MQRGGRCAGAGCAPFAWSGAWSAARLLQSEALVVSLLDAAGNIARAVARAVRRSDGLAPSAATESAARGFLYRSLVFTAIPQLLADLSAAKSDRALATMCAADVGQFAACMSHMNALLPGVQRSLLRVRQREAALRVAAHTRLDGVARTHGDDIGCAIARDELGEFILYRYISCELF